MLGWGASELVSGPASLHALHHPKGLVQDLSSLSVSRHPASQAVRIWTGPEDATEAISVSYRQGSSLCALLR